MSVNEGFHAGKPLIHWQGLLVTRPVYIKCEPSAEV